MFLRVFQKASRLFEAQNLFRSSLVYVVERDSIVTINSQPTLFGNKTTTSCLSGTASSLNPSQIVTYEEVKDLPNHPEKVLVDVREADELVATGKIPTAINIPLKTIEENLKLSPEEFFNKFSREKPNSETEMIFHCKGGGRGGRATELALSLGFANSKSYKGSWLDWSKREGLDEE